MALKYFEKSADKYLLRSRTFPWKLFREKEYSAVRNFLQIARPTKILDAGCGSGYYAIAINKDLGIPVSAIDASPRMIANLLKYSKNNPDISAKCLPIEQYREKSSVILMAGVLEFTDDPIAALKSCVDGLEAGGHLILLAPNGGVMGSIYRASHFFMGCPARNIKAHEIILAAEKFGLKLIAQNRCTPISNCILLKKTAYPEICG